MKSVWKGWKAVFPYAKNLFFLVSESRRRATIEGANDTEDEMTRFALLYDTLERRTHAHG
jgi:hypothetical protein